jgi:hypothetical protein
MVVLRFYGEFRIYWLERFLISFPFCSSQIFDFPPFMALATYTFLIWFPFDYIPLCCLYILHISKFLIHYLPILTQKTQSTSEFGTKNRRKLSRPFINQGNICRETMRRACPTPSGQCPLNFHTQKTGLKCFACFNWEKNVFFSTYWVFFRCFTNLSFNTFYSPLPNLYNTIKSDSLHKHLPPNPTNLRIFWPDLLHFMPFSFLSRNDWCYIGVHRVSIFNIVSTFDSPAYKIEGTGKISHKWEIFIRLA